MTDGPPAPQRPTARQVARSALHDVGRTVAQADLALAYAATVTVVTVLVLLQPAARQAEVLARLSGNLHNLGAEPLVSVLGSALVVENAVSLLLVVPLVVALAYLQRFVGRLGAVVIGLLGHVGAGLVVAAAVGWAIVHGVADDAQARVTDVGVSYVLATAMAFLVLAVPRRWRRTYLLATAAVWLVPAAITRTFTDLGHATALAIGLLLALVAARAVSASRRGGSGQEVRPRRAARSG